jgi:adenylate kinase
MILILGTPGAGKTTQTRLLAEYLGWKWYSMGELIRQKVTGDERKEMLEGKIISDEVTIRIIDESMTELGKQLDDCVWEGSPRSVPQAQWWLDQTKQGRITIKGIVHLVADLNVAEKRLLKRGRLDDHDDNVISTRFREYRKSIEPTLNFFKQNKVPVYEIDANGTIEEISQKIHNCLGV